MLQTKLKWIALLLLSFAIIGLQAQKAIPVSGGKASGSGGFISYTVGQVCYTTNSGSNGYVSQGVQQPYEISVLTGIEKSEGIKLEYSVFPNPSTDFLILKITNFKANNFNYQLWDTNGKLLETKRIESEETQITLQNYVRATYFLKITNNSKEVKVFKLLTR
jgi:hypothetical protein